MLWNELTTGWAEVRSTFSLPTDLLSSLESRKPISLWTKTERGRWQSLVEQKVERKWLSTAKARGKVLKELGEARFRFDVSGLLGAQEGETPLSSRALVSGSALPSRIEHVIAIDQLTNISC